jgi:hypothetical protein
MTISWYAQHHFRFFPIIFIYAIYLDNKLQKLHSKIKKNTSNKFPEFYSTKFLINYLRKKEYIYINKFIINKKASMFFFV